ncbi:ABC transporter ATP-binding protein [Actinocorallia longicatena]|uniref:ABC transporter ATP-binding protein n=1 Tax=Actinocorallia longicatena TaxID=111803 RepID=A0ABP6PVB3_9ACTN
MSGEDEAAPAARAEEISKVYGTGDAEVRALDGVSIDFPAGRFSAVMGPSGSGKSTLLHCMAGLDRVTSGRLWIGGDELTGMSDKELTRLRRDRVGFVFQAFNLVPTLTGAENVTLPAAIARRRPDEPWFERVVEAVGIGHRLRHRPSEMSGGEQQRIAAARALVARPAIVFADEPTGNLDSKASAEVLMFLRRSVDEFGQTIVMVTHEPTAAAYADHVVFLADGRIVSDMREPTAERVLDLLKELGG